MTKAEHGTSGGWHTGCRCGECKRAHDVRQQLLDAIYDGEPFRQALRDLGLTPNQVWGLAKTDEEGSIALEAALMATRREDLRQGTNAAYVAGCVCKECREHQRQRMAKNR
jgi:hypothetical protein